jgi:hypothetical protein
VGKACTATGGECKDNEEANVCLTSLSQANDILLNFCSFLSCKSDDACGTEATCYQVDGGISVCAPSIPGPRKC